MANQTQFGLEPATDGLRVRPFVPASIHAALFADSSSLVLNDYPHHGRRLTVILNLPADSGTGALAVTALRVDGMSVAGDLIAEADLVDGAVIEVDLGPGAGAATNVSIRDAGDYREVFGPRTPAISGISDSAGKVRVSFDLAGENPADLTLRVFRDGQEVADDLPGNTASWIDPDSDTGFDEMSTIADQNTSWVWEA